MRLLLRFLLGLYLTVVGVGGCAPALPPAAAGVAWQPGRYVQESYRSPDFHAEKTTYTLSSLTVEEAVGVTPEEFLPIFREEWTRAWQAAGLKTAAAADSAGLSGTVHHLSLKGAAFRRLTGRLRGSLTISGTITRGQEILFAFRDRVEVSSPLAPGPAPPKEREIFLRQLARETVYHLLNELLLQGFTAESG